MVFFQLNSKLKEFHMLVAKSSIETNASSSEIWSVWSDVTNWKAWDADVESSELDGQFQQGATGSLKPVGGPRVTIEVVDCVVNKLFTSKSTLPLGTSLVFEHKIKDADGKRKITHKVELHGILAPLFYCFLGGSIQRGLPTALRNLAATAETLR
jgi:hypothetical protein